FPSNPYVYAYQTFMNTTSGTTYNRILRIRASGNMSVSYSEILRLPPLSGALNHNGGVIAFGPDKMLYAVVGENANIALAQDPMSPMGKVLRMNSDGTAPSDNPFYTNASWNPLVYTYGHRNMFGLPFHPVTGRPYVTENGPNCNDEVNLLTPGRNYGWGPAATCATPPPAPNNTNQDGPNPVLPIKWWATTICPTNAAIYGGPYFPAFRGGQVTPHSYTMAGTYNVSLTVTDNESFTSTAYRDIVVQPGPPGAPVARFVVSPSPVDPDVPVTFNASTSYDSDGYIVSYAW